MLPTPLLWLRRIALAEGISYVLLLGIAMPLKYLADLPLAVRIVGSAHGALFVALCVGLLWALWSRSWHWSRLVAVFAASWIPGGAFWADRWFRTPIWQTFRPKSA
jgi:integral membrane protein